MCQLNFNYIEEVEEVAGEVGFAGIYNEESIDIHSTDNKVEGINTSLAEDYLLGDSLNIDSNKEEEEDVNNFRQIESQTLITQNGHTNYSLYLKEYNRDDLIGRQKFRTVKITRNNPKTFLLCYHCTLYLTESCYIQKHMAWFHCASITVLVSPRFPKCTPN